MQSLIFPSTLLETTMITNLNHIRVNLFTFYIPHSKKLTIIAKPNIMQIHILAVSISMFIFLNLSNLSSPKTSILIIPICI